MKVLHVPVLYGSQTGNSESAAKNLAESLPNELSTSAVKVTSTVMELDDFLEKSRAPWTPLCVIVCSSYGVGQAPIGAWKFREMMDLILEKDDYKNAFKGVKYAMLGLGDSKYTTFFLNPTALDSGMAKAGAERVGSLGKADASGKGDKVQLNVIEEWSKTIISDLKRVVKELEDMSEDQYEKKNEEIEVARKNTGDICKLIYEDWDKKEKPAFDTMQLLLAVLAVLIALYFNYKPKCCDHDH